MIKEMKVSIMGLVSGRGGGGGYSEVCGGGEGGEGKGTGDTA